VFVSLSAHARCVVDICRPLSRTQTALSQVRRFISVPPLQREYMGEHGMANGSNYALQELGIRHQETGATRTHARTLIGAQVLMTTTAVVI